MAKLNTYTVVIELTWNNGTIQRTVEAPEPGDAVDAVFGEFFGEEYYEDEWSQAKHVRSVQVFAGAPL